MLTTLLCLFFVFFYQFHMFFFLKVLFYLFGRNTVPDFQLYWVGLAVHVLENFPDVNSNIWLLICHVCWVISIISSGFHNFNGTLQLYNHATSMQFLHWCCLEEGFVVLEITLFLLSVRQHKLQLRTILHLFLIWIVMILRSHQVSLVTNQEQWLLIFYWSPRRLNFFVMSFTCPLFNVETALVLIPHGESMWNEKILFTGSVDVPLTRKGAEEAIEAGKRICNIPLDFVYNSALIRSQMTPVLALTQHRCKKVSILYRVIYILKSG